MLETAATDPYTSCGLRKVVCISHMEQFLIHHMSNRYVGTMGLPLSSVMEQLEALNAIDRRAHPATTLCGVETRLPEGEYSKSFYERPHNTLLATVPADAGNVLSIGCGWGATEAELKRRGANVTACPLDSVIGATAAKLGVKQVYGRLDECLTTLDGSTYDCVLITNLLHLQPDPENLFNRCVKLVREGGTLVVESPNFDRLPIWAKRILRYPSYQKLSDFTHCGVCMVGPRALVRAAKTAGLSSAEVPLVRSCTPENNGPEQPAVAVGETHRSRLGVPGGSPARALSRRWRYIPSRL